MPGGSAAPGCILYALVSRGSTILAEESLGSRRKAVGGNFATVAYVDELLLFFLSRLLAYLVALAALAYLAALAALVSLSLFPSLPLSRHSRHSRLFSSPSNISSPRY